MRAYVAVCGMALSVVAMGLAPHGPVQSQPAPRADPATKVELLFVQNAASGSFDGKTLTLKGVGPTLFFSDRPDRIAGQIRTADFVGHWTKGADNFAANPPNATLSVFGAKEVSSVVVVLTNPKLDRSNTLSYTVKILEGKLPASFKESSLFIDILGRWRMAAAGMAIGEERGYQEGQAAARAPAPAPAPAAPPAPAPPPAAQPASPPAPAPPAGLTASQASAVAKLKELKSLLDQGVITKSQYDADSQKLLDQIVK